MNTNDSSAILTRSPVLNPCPVAVTLNIPVVGLYVVPDSAWSVVGAVKVCPLLVNLKIPVDGV